MVEEALENKIIKKETNFDNIVNTTFKLGLKQNEKMQKQNVLLPHFEKIDRDDDNDKETIELRDQEQDEFDDVDV